MVQIIQDKDPIIKSSVITLLVMIEFITYKGEVPISPKIIPKATKSVAAETLLMF